MKTYPLRAALLLSQRKEAIHADDNYTISVKRLDDENVEMTISQTGSEPFIRESFLGIDQCECYLKQNDLPTHRWLPQELVSDQPIAQAEVVLSQS